MNTKIKNAELEDAALIDAALKDELRDALLTLIEAAEEGLYWNAQHLYTHKHEAWRGEVGHAIRIVRDRLREDGKDEH